MVRLIHYEQRRRMPTGGGCVIAVSVIAQERGTNPRAPLRTRAPHCTPYTFRSETLPPPGRRLPGGRARLRRSNHRKRRITPVASHVSGMSAGAQAELVKQVLHRLSQRSQQGRRVDLGRLERALRASAERDLTEKMIRKLRAGMMPPSGAKRPDADRVARWSRALESRMDALAAADPDPGWRPFQRLNRAEYAREVRQMLALDVDVTAFLRADTVSDGFDNVADVQTFSPTLMEGYLRAASRIADAGDRRSRQLGDARPPSSCRRRRRSWSASTARRSARAAASPSSTRSRPTASTCSAWTSSPSRSAVSSATPRPASRSKCRSTARAWRSSTSIRR